MLNTKKCFHPTGNENFRKTGSFQEDQEEYSNVSQVFQVFQLTGFSNFRNLFPEKVNSIELESNGKHYCVHVFDPGEGGKWRRYSRKFGWGCVTHSLKPSPYFRPKYVTFPTLFQT